MMLAITLKKKVENKGSQMGHTKKIFFKKKEKLSQILNILYNTHALPGNERLGWQKDKG